MAGELSIERRYLPNPKRETQALLLLLGLGATGMPVPRGQLLSKDHRDMTKVTPPDEDSR
jgi:hypothetical protein